MRRRDAIALVGATSIAWPGAALAQQPAMPMVGYLSPGSAEAVHRSAPAFHAGLKDSGYVEGRNVAFAYRVLPERQEPLPALASELVALKVAVIVANTSPAALVAKKATQTIPIAFMVAGDPVAMGLITSLGRPGGNATGINLLIGELMPKRLELLRELIPNAKSVAVLVDSAPRAVDPLVSGRELRELAELQAAARMIGLDLTIVEASTAHEIERAFARMAERRPDALLVSPAGLFSSQRDQVVGLAARHAIPAIHAWSHIVAAGGLISYGPSLTHAYRLLGVYTAKILDGAKPADLPVQQPTTFELVINLKTARALGITIPPSLLTRADDVIE
jgi:putative ABC transport system substrate-binding protein